MRNTMISPDTYRDDSLLASRGSYGHSGRACPIVVRYQKQLCAAIECVKSETAW